MPMKSGWYGSSTIRLPIDAPLNPNATSTSGPRPQVEAKAAVVVATVAATDTGFDMVQESSSMAAFDKATSSVSRVEPDGGQQ